MGISGIVQGAFAQRDADRATRRDPDLQIVEDAQADRVRLRTLIALRWMAIAGQLGAIAIATVYFGFSLDIGLCLSAVGASAIVNIVAAVIYPGNKRLSETAAMLTLLFDIAQLAFLLFLTGGLSNPFSFLMLAPVTISASALQLRSTVTLGAAAIAMVTALVFVHRPLRLASGAALELPGVFATGFWLAIVIGIVFLGVYAYRVAREIRAMRSALFATQMALDREQKLTDLGGVVAAAAHELGTPLATIKLVSAELIAELGDRPDLRDDAALIRAQADRCGDILRAMGRAGNDDPHLRQAPLAAIVAEAAEPHVARGKELVFIHDPLDDGDDRMPVIYRRPEIIHGMRNLVQNAVDFARNRVWIDTEWSARHIVVRVSDDGPGFSASVLGRIGDPFVRSRRPDASRGERPEYEGMGLGLFIAKTLLERTGAELSFANGTDPLHDDEVSMGRSGAIVEVVWPRTRIEAAGSDTPGLDAPPDNLARG